MNCTRLILALALGIHRIEKMEKWFLSWGRLATICPATAEGNCDARSTTTDTTNANTSTPKIHEMTDEEDDFSQVHTIGCYRSVVQSRIQNFKISFELPSNRLSLSLCLGPPGSPSRWYFSHLFFPTFGSLHVKFWSGCLKVVARQLFTYCFFVKHVTCE